MDKLISKILTTRRCHNSQGELQFVAWLHGELKSMGYEPKAMAEGCVVVENQDAKHNRVMFSCHVDTMHGKKESDDFPTQEVMFDPNFGHIFVADKSSGSCLGADDGAGIYIMLSMLKAKVKGTYVFHRGEERGCIGSRAMLATKREWLDQFDQCIAFDRPNTDEVIITQGGTVCASEAYGAALAEQLNTIEPSFKYATSVRGVLTDSKIYNGVISECVNLGVGYSFQHSKEECQDWEHLQRLTAACILVDWSKLPIKRVPPPPVPVVDAYEYRGYYGNHFSQGSPMSKNAPIDYPPPKPRKKLSTKDVESSLFPKSSKGGAVVAPIKSRTDKAIEPDLKLAAEIEAMDFETLIDYLGDSELAKAFVVVRSKYVAEKARADFLLQVMGV